MPGSQIRLPDKGDRDLLDRLAERHNRTAPLEIRSMIRERAKEAGLDPGSELRMARDTPPRFRAGARREWA